MRSVWVALALVGFCVLMIPLTSVTAMADDSLRPEISSWGIVGNALGGESFRAWANVSDSGSGVRNVTLIIASSFVPESNYPLPYNGSLYTGIIPPLAFSTTYMLSLIAFDMANNSATSIAIAIDRRVPTTTPVDPAATWPAVVTSSLAFMLVVLLVAFRYDRQRGQGQ